MCTNCPVVEYKERVEFISIVEYSTEGAMSTESDGEDSIQRLLNDTGQEFELTDDTLNVPPLSIIDSGEETDILSEVINSPVELLQSIKLDLEKTCNIYIRRSYVLEDFRRASLRKDFYPCRKLHVQFMGEPGIDVGGLTKEFLDILSRKICTWHVFTGNTGSLTLSASVLSLMQELPYSAGVAVGIILCHLKTAVPIFSESLIRHIAGSNNFSIEDIPENEEIKKVLSKLQNNEELISCNEIAAIQNELDYFKDLKNINNKKEFISLACRYFCSVKNGAHIAQFIKGLQQTKVADLIKGHPDVMVKLLTGSKFEQKGMDANVIYETLNFSYSAEGSNLYQHEQNASYYLLQFLMDCCCSNGIHSPNDSELSGLSHLDAPNESLYMIGGVLIAMFLVGVIIVLLAVTISKLRKREEHSNSVHPTDVVLQTAPAAPAAPQPPAATVLPQSDPLPYRGQVLWQFPPQPQYLYSNNNQETLVQNLPTERPGFVQGFRKNLGGRWRRLVKRKPTPEVYTIPPELRPQLKTIYVY